MFISQVLINKKRKKALLCFGWFVFVSLFITQSIANRKKCLYCSMLQLHGFVGIAKTSFMQSYVQVPFHKCTETSNLNQPA